MLKTISDVVKIKADGIKIHILYITKDAPMAKRL